MRSILEHVEPDPDSSFRHRRGERAVGPFGAS